MCFFATPRSSTGLLPRRGCNSWFKSLLLLAVALLASVPAWSMTASPPFRNAVHRASSPGAAHTAQRMKSTRPTVVVGTEHRRWHAIAAARLPTSRTTGGGPMGRMGESGNPGTKITPRPTHPLPCVPRSKQRRTKHVRRLMNNRVVKGKMWFLERKSVEAEGEYAFLTTQYG